MVRPRALLIRRANISADIPAKSADSTPSTCASSERFWASPSKTVSQTLTISLHRRGCPVCSPCSVRRLRWFGHVSRMEDGTIPKDILGELAIGTRPTGRPLLRFKDVCQRDMKAGNVNPAGWEGVAAYRSQWRLALKAGIQACEERRAEKRDEKRGR